MGRFHHHSGGTPGGTTHSHEHDDDGHTHDSPTHDAVREVGDHGGYETGSERVMILEQILSENDRIADTNRAELSAHGVRTVNLMSSPGAGKTTLLAKTIPALADELRIGIVEGDIATSLDADQLSGLGAQVSLVNTDAGFGGECHLDAVMVRSGLARLDLDEIDLLIVENVGNLVCPAEFDVGQDVRAMVYAITEGEEKPLKYPVMFHAVDVIVVNKLDLLPHLKFDMAVFRDNLQGVNPDARVFELSAETGDGLEAWVDWLRTLLVV